MMSGKELHRVLEAEVKDEGVVAVSSPEDAWALKLVDSIMCFRQLMKQGMTRETYVFGQLQVCNGAGTELCPANCGLGLAMNMLTIAMLLIQTFRYNQEIEDAVHCLSRRSLLAQVHVVPKLCVHQLPCWHHTMLC